MNNQLKYDLLLDAGQACLQWSRDMGECHLCDYDVATGVPHDDECPIGEIEKEQD